MAWGSGPGREQLCEPSFASFAETTGGVVGGTRRPLPCLAQGRPAARLLQEEQEGGDDGGVGSPSPQGNRKLTPTVLITASSRRDGYRKCHRAVAKRDTVPDSVGYKDKT